MQATAQLSPRSGDVLARRLSSLPSEQSLVEAFLAARSPATRRSYDADLRDFAKWLGVLDVNRAASELLGRSQGEANALVHGYKLDMVNRRGLAPNTIARRLSALRSLAKMGRMIGRSAVFIEVESPRAENVRETAFNHGLRGAQALWSEATARATTERGKRNRAILALGLFHGLRRGECLSTNVAHFDADAGKLHIRGKGRKGRQAITLCEPAKKAITDYLAERGDDLDPREPMFLGRGGRFRGDSWLRALRTLGKQAGLGAQVRPHALRHCAVTLALDSTKGDLRRSQRFSRHRSVVMLQRYDDRRADDHGAIATALGGLIGGAA